MIMITIFPNITLLMWKKISVQVFYDTLTILNEKKFSYVESSKFSMLVDHEKNDLGAGLLLNSFMMLLKIIMREEHMLVGVAIISTPLCVENLEVMLVLPSYAS